LSSLENIKKIAGFLDKLPGMAASISGSAIQITLGDRVLFPSGSAEISPRAFKMLDSIIAVIGPLQTPICIEGHTDNIPVMSGGFASNWELSVQRATNVVKYFIDEGNISPTRLSAAGYGATKPVFPNDSLAHRAMNRRVEVILSMEGMN
jgi:chemotaxis protein MotB